MFPVKGSGVAHIRPAAILAAGYHIVHVGNNSVWDGGSVRDTEGLIREREHVNSVGLGDDLNREVQEGMEKDAWISSMNRTSLLSFTPEIHI